jgi:hypothetical protein
MAALGLLRRAPARRGLVSRAVRAVKRAHLRFVISSAQQYIAKCRRDGITTTQTLADWEQQVFEDRVRLYLLRD